VDVFGGFEFFSKHSLTMAVITWISSGHGLMFCFINLILSVGAAIELVSEYSFKSSFNYFAGGGFSTV